METKTIPELHREHTEWLNKLAFYADDLKIMEHRVKEMIQRAPEKDVLAMAEHFQNQIIIQQVQVDSLKEGIWYHEKNLQEKVNKNPNASDTIEVEDHSEQREKIERFEEIVNELRKELINFLAKVF